MKPLFKKIVQSGILICACFFQSSESLANDQGSEITIVYQLKDIQTTDWQYQALDSLAETYNCTSRLQNNNHNSSITRYEFALGLHNCLKQIENSISSPDLITWERLQQDFAPELAQLKDKIDAIEATITGLESRQFAPTSTLNGQVLFILADSFEAEDKSETFLGYRSRLDFNTSFSGQDRLEVRLESRKIGRLDRATGTLLTRLAVDGGTDNRVELGELSYIFSPLNNTQVLLGTIGVGLNDIGEVLSPFSSSGSGAISRFGRRDPATLRGSGGAGFGIKYRFSEKISASAGYVIDSRDIANPKAGNGIFGSSASAIAQIVVEPEEELALALTYTHIYQKTDDVNLMGSTGLKDSNEPFGDNATTAHNLGLQLNWEVSSGFEIGGWFGYTQALQQRGGDDRATILNGALTLAFPDLGRENNLGGIIVGVPPAIANHDNSSLIAEKTPLHIEALYRIEINDYIRVTPGIFTIINPDTKNGNTIWVGTVRTEFRF
ncbi:MAG: iron uptake porin [Xenococcaceae cyanobacterium MO_167.B52]|nr:iron uptake porin [Xenococcaceae cyanobacterium MO_167.B52]